MLDISMSKAQYIIGEAIKIHINASPDARIAVTVRHLADAPIPYQEGMLPPAVGGYGVDAVIDGVVISTAFDVVADRRERIRYGFLSDFAKEDEDDGADIAWLIKAHLNAVQFYDWMYRHDTLLPPTPEYDDPLGRILSYSAIRAKIEGCLTGGMVPMAYGAIYAASNDFWQKRRDWGLFRRDGQPMSFGGWLYFMDIRRGSPWRGHILSEFAKAGKKAGFRGIHMDTYGFPKNAHDAEGAPIDLAVEFPSLIAEAKEGLLAVHDDAAIIFNCVGNWPTEAVAQSRVDAVYIEVWPPYERYTHLLALIRGALTYGGKKPVILAAYMSPFKTAESDADVAMAENALLLAYSVIHASGGTQLVFGENACVLCDPYYVEHKALRPDFLPVLQAYLDHTVRMAELLDARAVEYITGEFTGGINTEIIFSGANCHPFPEAGTVWTAVGRSDGRYILQLVNLTGLEHDFWNRPQGRPDVTDEIGVEALVDHQIKGVYMASPDAYGGRPQSLSYAVKDSERGQVLCFSIASVALWSTVWIEFEP